MTGASIERATKEEPSLKVSFVLMSVRKNEPKFQSTAFLLVYIQILIHFYALS